MMDFKEKVLKYYSFKRRNLEFQQLRADLFNEIANNTVVVKQIIELELRDTYVDLYSILIKFKLFEDLTHSIDFVNWRLDEKRDFLKAIIELHTDMVNSDFNYVAFDLVYFLGQNQYELERRMNNPKSNYLSKFDYHFNLISLFIIAKVLFFEYDEFNVLKKNIRNVVDNYNSINFLKS